MLARTGAELVLHGHEHELVEESLPGPGGPIPVRCIPSGSYDGDRPGRTARWRSYRIEGGKLADFDDRVFSRRAGRFVAAT